MKVEGKIGFPNPFLDLLLSLLHRNVCNSVYIRSRAAQNRKKPKTQNTNPNPRLDPKTQTQTQNFNEL